MSILLGTHRFNHNTPDEYYKLKAHEPRTPWALAIPPFAITGAILGALLKRQHSVAIGAGAGAMLGTGLKFLDDQTINHARDRIRNSNRLLTNIEDTYHEPATLQDKGLSYV